MVHVALTIFTCCTMAFLQTVTPSSEVRCSAIVRETTKVQIVCKFGRNINQTRRDFNVKYSKSHDANAIPDTLLICNWLPDLECETMRNCSYNNLVTDELTLETSLSFDETGEFTCHVVSTDDTVSVPCHLKNSTAETTTVTLVVGTADVSRPSTDDVRADNKPLVSCGDNQRHNQQCKCKTELWINLSATLAASNVAFFLALGFSIFLLHRERKRLKAKYSNEMVEEKPLNEKCVSI